MTQPFQLLQIKVISARDLAPVSRSMQTYVVAWINPARKLTTRVDQKGNTDPEWNDRFLFRVAPTFLYSDSAIVEIEIYSQSCWIHDTLVGSVRVPAASIVPANPKGQARRAVALQIRRPSGRPRGILNIVVSLLDGTMKSMPLSGLGYPSEKGSTLSGPGPRSEAASTIRRVKSERSWSVNDEVAQPKSTINGPGRPGSEVARPRSTVNGPSSKVAAPAPNGSSICNSDVGPSASVVATAMARGLYLPPAVAKRASGCGGKKVKDDGESSILQWADEDSEEGLMTKIERWRTELHNNQHVYGRDGAGARHKGRHRRKKTEGGRLFRCFGKAYGFEFTIVCGANQGSNNNKVKKVHHKIKKMHPPSSDGDSNSESYIV